MKTDLDHESLPRMSSVLGENAVVIGNAAGQGDLDVRGRVQGDVLLKGRALISEGGVVLGRVEAISVSVAGQVRGDITALEEIQIHPTGDVEGNISAPRVSILAGARVLGSLRAGDTAPRAVAPRIAEASYAQPLAASALDVTSEPNVSPVLARPSEEFQPSQVAPLPLPSSLNPTPRRGKPKAIPSFQRGARAELKDAE